MTTLSPLRVGRVTGSRVSSILGLNKYATAENTLRDMVREHFGEEPEFTGNEATQWGNDHEDDAITAYEQSRSLMVHSGQLLVLHPDIDWIAVTPDGFVEDDGMVEVKCPHRARYTHIDEKPDYEAQIRLQLECTGREWCDFVVWRPGAINVSRVVRDLTWFPSVLGQLAEFHERFLSVIADPKLAAPYREPLVAVRVDEEWRSAVAEWKATRAGAEAAKAAEDRLKELAAGKPTQGWGAAVTVTPKKGSIDYKAAVEKFAYDVDLEEFRKPAPAPAVSIKETA